jgi:hypothetical protein
MGTETLPLILQKNRLRVIQNRMLRKVFTLDKEDV